MLGCIHTAAPRTNGKQAILARPICHTENSQQAVFRGYVVDKKSDRQPPDRVSALGDTGGGMGYAAREAGQSAAAVERSARPWDGPAGIRAERGGVDHSGVRWSGWKGIQRPVRLLGGPEQLAADGLLGGQLAWTDPAGSVLQRDPGVYLLAAKCGGR